MNTVIIGNNCDVKRAISDLLTDVFGFSVHTIPIRRQLVNEEIGVLQNADLIVLDLTTANSSTRLLIIEIREILPFVKIIALHIYKEIGLVRPFLIAGANAYLLIETLHSEMGKAIETINSGQPYISIEVR